MALCKSNNIDFECSETTKPIPYLPPEIIEHIVSLLLFNINEVNDNTQYTLLNLFTVFPYLLRQIKTTLCFTYEIPLHIYNFLHMKIDNVFDLLVILEENLQDMYHLDDWLKFITCEHSPFYNTDEGIQFVNYILNRYSNHQKKKIANNLLCNILDHNIITKSLDNIIFNKLVNSYEKTDKLKLSLLSNKEKKVFLVKALL